MEIREEPLLSSPTKWFKSDGLFPLGAIKHTQPTRGLSYSKALRMDPCAYCLGEGGTYDHIEPKHPIYSGHKPGGNGWDNLTGACSECNGTKGSHLLLLFIIKSGGLRA